MAVKVKFTHDGMSADAELSVGDYFLAKNGEEVVVTDETLQRFELDRGMTLEKYLEGSIWSVKHATKKEVEEAYPDANVEEVPFVEDHEVADPAINAELDAREGGEN